MDAEANKFRAELAGLIFANMAGAVIGQSVVTSASRDRGPKPKFDRQFAYTLLLGCPALAVAAADGLLTELNRPRR
jgi:hypothetical protein